MTAITAIQVTLMTPSATIITIRLMLEPAQQSPNLMPELEPGLSQHWRRKRRLSGVIS